jgi:hypothetical protein
MMSGRSTAAISQPFSPSSAASTSKSPSSSSRNGVRSEGDLGCDLVEMELHGFAVASRQHEGGAGSTFGTDRTKQISRLGPLIVGGTGT